MRDYGRSMTSSAASLAITVVGGPTALLEWAGLRLLLDPTFDAPQRYGPDPDDLEKTAGPAVAFNDLGRIDAALVSHHHHEDNLDTQGRNLALTPPLVVTTPAGAEDLGTRGGTARIVGLADDENIALDDALVVGATIAALAPVGARLHALPAQHGPDEWAERLGPVCGYLLTAPGHPTVYVSGDNSEVSVVEAIVARYGAVDAAVLFAGAARVDMIDAALTLTAADARAAALEREFAGLESPAGGPLLAHTPTGTRTEVGL